MRKIQIVLLCVGYLFFVTSTVTAQKAKNTMTNADVVEMVKAGLPESTIVLAIQQSEPNFDTSPKALIELKTQGTSQKIMDAMLQAQPTKSVPQNKSEVVNPIATKEIGSLRVVLKSIIRVNLPDRRSGSGIRCVFELINLETQKPIFVAMNAVAPDRGFNQIGSYLRSTLVDENGGVWKLLNSDVAGGIGKVGVGMLRWGIYYDPSEIVTVLSKRDSLNSDMTTISGNEVPFIFGIMTEISPGQSLTITAIFDRNEYPKDSDTPPKVFQMASEIIVGIVNTGTKKSYTLYNLTFDRISLPVKSL